MRNPGDGTFILALELSSTGLVLRFTYPDDDEGWTISDGEHPVTYSRWGAPERVAEE